MVQFNFFAFWKSTRKMYWLIAIQLYGHFWYDHTIVIGAESIRFCCCYFCRVFFSLSLTPPRRVQMKFLLTPPPPAPPTYACTHTQYTNTRAYLLVRWIFCTLFVSMMNKHFNRWWRVYFQKKIIQINIVRPKQTKSEPYAIDAHFKGSNTKKIDTFMHMVN